MQWVSTFASGASSLGRPRRLAGTRLNQVHQAPREKFGENSPHLLGNIEEGKSEKKSLGEAKHSLGLLVTAFPGTETHPAMSIAGIHF